MPGKATQSRGPRRYRARDPGPARRTTPSRLRGASSSRRRTPRGCPPPCPSYATCQLRWGRGGSSHCRPCHCRAGHRRRMRHSPSVLTRLSPGRQALCSSCDFSPSGIAALTRRYAPHFHLSTRWVAAQLCSRSLRWAYHSPIAWSSRRVHDEPRHEVEPRLDRVELDVLLPRGVVAEAGKAEALRHRRLARGGGEGGVRAAAVAAFVHGQLQAELGVDRLG